MTAKNDDLARTEDEREEWTESERQAEHKIRMRFEYKDLVEDLIQDAMERGAFDNLKGKGKPLELDRGNVFEGDKRLANSLMKEHDLLPPWLARRNVIYVEIEELRRDIGRRWQRHSQAFRFAQDNGRRTALLLSWDQQCRAWEQEIAAINSAIDDYNLRRPTQNMELYKLRLADELQKAGARRSLD